MRDLERRHTIMGVDDDEITRDMLSLILSELGNVEFATSGEEALEKVEKIDHFKAVNDTYGHSVGDTALKETVAVIQDIMRAQDTLGRLGGEEFAVIVPETDAEVAAVVAERIRDSVAQIVMDTPDGPFGFTMRKNGAETRSYVPT